MDKAILIIDMPRCCNECFAIDDSGDYPLCRITQEQKGYTFRTREQKMDECPLKKMPYKKKYNNAFDAGIFGINPEEERAYIKGWNDYIDEIICK